MTMTMTMTMTITVMLNQSKTNDAIINICTNENKKHASTNLQKQQKYYKNTIKKPIVVIPEKICLVLCFTWSKYVLDYIH